MHVAMDVRPVQAGFAGDRVYLENLVRRLRQLPGISCISLYGESRLGEDVGLELGGKCRGRVFSARRGWLWTPWAVPRHLRLDAVDVYHAPYLIPVIAPCPTVVTIHDIGFRVLPEYYSQHKAHLRCALVGLSAHRAGAIITDSESSRADIARVLRVGPGRIHVIPLAASEAFTPGDRDRARRWVVESLGVDPPFVLAVGYASARKNVARLIEAVEAVVRRRPGPLSLVIAGTPGDEPEGALRSRFPSLGERLVFTGGITEAALVDLYRAADVFAFPSLYEGFGLPVLEAMACGTPVVAANSSSLPEVAGDAALLVDPGDVGALAEALERVLFGASLASDLVGRGLARAAQFSWERTAELTHEVYRSVLDR